MRLGSVIIFSACALWATHAFDAKEFKKCSDLSFCRRNRAFGQGSTPPSFQIAADSVQVEEKGISAILRNVDEQADFKLSLQILENPTHTIRLRIDEAKPESKRFEPPFILKSDILVPSSVETGKDEKVATLRAGPVKVVLEFSPFKLRVFRNELLVLIMNNRGLFNFEHYRPRPENPEQGTWEETFKSHTDSKPKGPASFGTDFTFVGAKHVYGIPEHATNFALKTTRGDGAAYDEPYRMYNLDVFEYSLDSPFGLYGSVPFMMAHTKSGTSAVFVLNTSEMYVDVYPVGDVEGAPSSTSHWYAESGMIDVFIMLGPSPADVLTQFTTLTGSPYMPPRFSLAYNQCRWNYKDEADVDMVDDTFDDHDIPYDVLWLDIEHTDGKKYFTWDNKLFPNPKAMQEDLAGKGRCMVTIVDPHIKRDSGYHLHNKATNDNLYVKTKDGRDFEGHCWPGASSYMDFLNPLARDAYADEYVNYEGATQTLHTWNDMNEPSVFNGPEVTMQKDLIHMGGVEHRDIHNMYGMLHHMASHSGLIKRLAGKRPFILTRSFFAGSQQYAGVWTGDNMANWDHLEIAQPMLLSLGVAGIPHVGSDVGGFFNNPETELLVRWYQAGAYHPFFRAHAHIDTKRREPWLFGEPHTSNIRSAIRARYRLLPYWYTIARATNVTGVPMMRPLFFEFPEDESTFAMENQFMVGPAVLVKPVAKAGATSSEVYLPGSQGWYDLEDGTPYSTSGTVTVSTPITKIPVFQRGGSIIPKRERARRSSTLMDRDPITLVVALDQQGNASGDLYLDDGETYAFLEGNFIHREFKFQDGVLTNTVKAQGSYRDGEDVQIERVIIRGLNASPKSITKQDIGLSDSLTFNYDAQTKQLTIRKPLISVGKDWKIIVAQ